MHQDQCGLGIILAALLNPYDHFQQRYYISQVNRRVIFVHRGLIKHNWRPLWWHYSPVCLAIKYCFDPSQRLLNITACSPMIGNCCGVILAIQTWRLWFQGLEGVHDHGMTNTLSSKQEVVLGLLDGRCYIRFLINGYWDRYEWMNI